MNDEQSSMRVFMVSIYIFFMALALFIALNVLMAPCRYYLNRWDAYWNQPHIEFRTEDQP
jgi:hypothetical protein